MPYNRLNIKKYDYLITSDIDYMKGKINQYKQDLINWNTAITTKLTAANASYVASDSLAHTIKMIMKLATKQHSYLGISTASVNSLRYDPSFNNSVMLLDDEGNAASYIKLKLALNLYGERELSVIDEGAITKVMDGEGNEMPKVRMGSMVTIDFKDAAVDGEDFDKAYITAFLMANPEKLTRVRLVENSLDNPVVMMSIHNTNCELEGFASLGTTSIAMENSAVELTGVNMFSYPEVAVENAAMKVMDDTDDAPVEVVNITPVEEPSTGGETGENKPATDGDNRSWWEKLQDYINGKN